MKKILFDFLPLILFFVALKVFDIYVATGVAMAVSVLQIVWLTSTGKKIDVSLWISLVVIVLFGGATILLHDEAFIKWKPTVLYWIFAFAIVATKLFFKKNLIQKLMGSQIDLPAPVWDRMNYSWAGFFSVVGLLNLYVAFSGNFSLDQWATFKVFGMTILLIVFAMAQSLWLSKYLKDDGHE